jgi:type II secretory pathway component GspD/PulD (secretin)
MKTAIALLLLAALTMASPSVGSAAEGLVQFESGEMKLSDFLAMVSEKLDIQIDASGLGGAIQEIVSIPETGPLSPERAQAVVLTALNLAGDTWIHDSRTGFYRVLRQRDARDLELPAISDEKRLPDNDLMVNYVMRLGRTPPEYVARNIRSFMPANSRIIPDEMTRSLMITDSARNIAKLRKLVEKLDTPQAAQQARIWLEGQAKQAENPCPAMPWSETQAPKPVTLIALFSLIALVIGFLMRGYVIRRIEGGL